LIQKNEIMEKSKAKAARKNLQETIENGLIKELKGSTSQIVKSSKKLDKLINKSSRKVAKKITKKLSRIGNKKSTIEASSVTKSADIIKSAVKLDSKQAKTSPATKAPESVVTVKAVQTKSNSPVKKTIVSRKPKVVSK
jgi:hypothetical protein